MSRIRLRQKQLIVAGAIGGAIVLLLSVGTGYLYISKLQHKYKEHTSKIEQQLALAQKQLNEERSAITVVKENHLAGTILREEDLVTMSVPRAAIPDNAVDDLQKLIGKYPKIDLQKNTLITSPMLYEEGVTPNDLRNQEFKLIQLPFKLSTKDFVDVRIKFPTGQDYIVLSKKKVQDLNNGTIWYQMNEEEILLMSSAIVDAFINDATIYALSYVDPYMQEKAYVNYPPNAKVQELILTDPNIVNVATKYLEKRLREKLEQDIKSMPEDERQKYNSGKSNLNTNPSGSTYYEEGDEGKQGTGENSAQNNPLLDSTETPDFNAGSGSSGQDSAATNSEFKDYNETVPFEG